MELELDIEHIREAVRQYVTSMGFTLAIPKTVNQNTGLKFRWKPHENKKLSVSVKVKENK